MQNFMVDGMTYGHCERAAKGAVQALDANVRAPVNPKAGLVSTESLIAPDLLADAIRDAGKAEAAAPAT